MKVTLTLTKEEILSILSESFEVVVDDFTITNPSTMAARIRSAIEPLRYTTDQKIQAIKTLRQLAVDHNWLTSDNAVRNNFDGKLSFSLDDSKWAIENFPTFIAFVEKNDRLPFKGYYQSGYLS